MTGFAKRAAVEPRLLAPEVTAVGASQGVKYQVAVSIEFSHLSERNSPKYFTALMTNSCCVNRLRRFRPRTENPRVGGSIPPLATAKSV